MKIAFLFPGQGSQAVGMGRSLAETEPAARSAFDQADAALGFPLSSLCFDGPDESLRLTENTQPALLAASVAALRALEARGVRAEGFAGHSLGEYSALVAAGALAFADALRAVRLRGRYMQEAVPVGEGAMAAILMLEAAKVEEACREAAQGEVVSAANINCPGQVVIAGASAAVERAIAGCLALGARRAVKLPVSAPFHCALMKPAEARLESDLSALEFSEAGRPVFRNVDGEPQTSAAMLREGLVRQVSLPVQWEKTLRAMAREGFDTFVELGPGTVVSGLVRKTLKGAKVLNVEDEASLEKAVEGLKGSERGHGVQRREDS